MDDFLDCSFFKISGGLFLLDSSIRFSTLAFVLLRSRFTGDYSLSNESILVVYSVT